MNFNDGFPRRVAAARNSLGLTQSELAKKVGIVTRQIAAYEGGEAKPRMKVLETLAAALGTTPTWLSSGTGESPDILNTRSTVTVTEIPVISLGRTIEFIQNGKSIASTAVSGFIPAPINASSDSFAVEIHGDSMMSSLGISFPEGTIVTFEPDIEPTSGDFILGAIDNIITFKQLIENTDGAYLRPLNSAYVTVKLTDDVKILGVAIHGQFNTRDKKSWFPYPHIDIHDPSINTYFSEKNDCDESIPNIEISQRLDKIESMLEQLLSKR
ncbi:LexA family protein [Providencia rettgeri]|nr:helix-turn-helix domain-containing protein [Providencia rettgeri]